MKKYMLPTLILFVCFLYNTSSFAYEVNTHEKITENALNKSLQERNFLDDIGYTSKDMLNGKSIEKWFQEGSRLEDETIPSDWGGAWARYRHHYFDPVYNRGLIFWTGNGYKAPDWALEDTAAYSSQFYSIQDAKQYYLLGLTATDKTERGNNLAKTFRTLGQVLHTIEDMAQPQHTRNDAHGGFFGYDFGPQIFGVKSQYEIWASDEGWSLKYNPPYPVVFNSYRQFYITGNGKGIAEFSNRNFVTEGTNIDCSNIIDCNGATGGGYPSPTLDLSLSSEISIKDLYARLGKQTNLDGYVTFFGNRIIDHYSGENITNYLMTTYSVFDRDLKKKGKSPAFTLNRFNFDAMANILIPRAVGYSAGLLNYFFRGQMEANGEVAKDSSGNITGITIKVKNVTTNEDMRDGNFVVSYKYKPTGSNEYVYGLSGKQYFGTIPYNNDPENYKYTFNFPAQNPIPKDAADVQYILVFQGTLGNEQGAVVGRVVTIATSKKIYVTDRYNHNVQIYDSKTHLKLGEFGSYGTGNGQFKFPRGIAVDGNYIYVLDRGNTRIQIFNKDTYSFVSKIEGYYGPNTADKVGYRGLTSIAVDDNYIYIGELFNLIKVFNKSTLAFEYSIGTTSCGYYCYGDGKFISIWSLAIGSNPSILYIGAGEYNYNANNKILKVGTGIEKYRIGSNDGAIDGIDSDDNYIYLAISNNVSINNPNSFRIHILDKNTYSLINSFGSYGTGDGQFNSFSGLVVDENYIYVTSLSRGYVYIFEKISPYTYKGTFGSAPFYNGIGGIAIK